MEVSLLPLAVHSGSCELRKELAKALSLWQFSLSSSALSSLLSSMMILVPPAPECLLGFGSLRAVLWSPKAKFLGRDDHDIVLDCLLCKDSLDCKRLVCVGLAIIPPLLGYPDGRYVVAGVEVDGSQILIWRWITCA